MADEHSPRNTLPEDRLRALFETSAGDAGAIDTASIIRRSRRRRRISAVGVAGASTLAAVGIGAAAITGLSVPLPASHMADESGEFSTLSEAADPGRDLGGMAPSTSLTQCSAPTSPVTPSSTGLIVTPRFADVAAADGTQQLGTVTLSNEGPETLRGTVARPILTLSRDGVTVWNSGEPDDAPDTVIDLAPGEAVDIDASYFPVHCEPDTDTGGSETQRPLDGGTYRITAAIVFVHDGGSTVDVITGPGQDITLR